MIRLATALWLVLVAFVGFGMFKVKYEVMDLEDALARANRAIAADQDAIHVLKAEWAFLAQPSRLAELSRRHLDLVPLSTAQLGQIDAIALRPGTQPPTVDNGALAPARPQIATTALVDGKTRIDR